MCVCGLNDCWTCKLDTQLTEREEGRVARTEQKSIYILCLCLCVCVCIRQLPRTESEKGSLLMLQKKHRALQVGTERVVKNVVVWYRMWLCSKHSASRMCQVDVLLMCC